MYVYLYLMCWTSCLFSGYVCVCVSVFNVLDIVFVCFQGMYVYVYLYLMC